jgi:predicted RNase H-like HicB family nuclease
MQLRYPIAIEPGDDTHAYGVVVPDLPGCFSAGDSYADAVAQAREVISLHLAFLACNRKAAPLPTDLGDLQRRAEYAGWMWTEVAVTND